MISFFSLVFILVEEALNRALYILFSQDHIKGRAIKGISSPRGCIPPSHMLYADDLIIFCNASLSIVEKVMGLLDDYGMASG